MRLHFFFMVLGLIGPDITLCEPRNQSIHPNPSIHVSSTSTCISLSTFTAAGSAPVAGVYAGDDGVLEHDLSALLVGILTDFASANDPRQLRLCVDLQGSLFPSEPVAHSPQTPHSNNPVGTSSLLAEPLTKSVTTTDYYVYVSYSEDTASNTTACSSPNGDCNFRSAVAYCESLLLLEGLTCVIDMPELGAIFIDPSIGQISVRSTAAGTLIIEGNGCVLSSESQSSTTPRLLFLDNVPALYFFVHNMTLHKFGNADANGGVIYLSELRYVAITHVVFSDSIGYNGGGLYIDNTDDVIISDCVFQNVTGWYGAGISLFAYTVNAIISRCIFIDTHAIWQGGALTLFSNSDRTTIIDCSFVRTTAVNSGGALFAYSASDYLFIINCTFLSTHSMDMGGAITFFNGNVLSQILDSTFIGTTAGKFGGAIYFGDANKLALFARCVFNDTDAGIDGGAIYLLSTNEKTTISDCDFIDNTAGKGGGALYLHDNNPSLIVKDSWFRGCRTGNDGGAIFMLSYNNEAIIDGCHFLSTSAFQHGGAIVLYDNNYLVTISKSSFANTSAGLDGGAIYLYDSNDGIEILLSTFIGSTAFGSGGAIHIFASGDSAVISSVVFIDNISEEGGAVFIGNGNGNIKFRDSIFSNNTALVLNGGAVLLSNKNIDVRFEKCIFGGNIAAYGGGIAAVSSNTGVVVDNCTFHDNAALSAGGAIHLSVANSHFSIDRSSFSSNRASSGGGVYFGDYHTDLKISHTSFTSNLGTYGAGVYITQYNEDVIFDNTTMLANIASEEGGGMFILSKDLLISQSSFINNESPNSGGIYARVTDLTIINSKFHGNMGNDDFGVSGGIFLDKILVAFIDSVDFFNNSASTGGAISLASCSNVRFSNCNFRDNIANNVDGGAIWSFGSNFDITNTFFRNNSGWRNGGAVSVSDAESARISNCSFDNNMVFTGSGSSIWISASIFAAIFDNNFYNNVALNGSGGAVYWMWATMPAPLNLTELNYFWNNDALYGCDVATEAIKLTLNESNVYNITDYTQPVPVVIAYLHDYYGQTVQTQSSSLLAASVLSAVQCYQSVGYLTGGYVEQFRAGVASFEDLLAYCDPGYAMPIDLTTTIAGRTLTVSFVLKFRECVTGEYVGDSVCSKCPDGTFSVTNPATVSSLSELSQQNVCLKCPDGADNCNSGTVNLKDGYWRISEYAASTMSCPYVRSCIGGSGVGDDLCADGYYGPVCGVCSDGYSFRRFTQECEPCSRSAGLDLTTILLLIFLALVGLGFLVVNKSPNCSKYRVNLEDLSIFIFSSMGLLKTNSLHTTKIASILRRRLKARLKLYITLWQIISLLPFTLDLKFPNLYNSVASFLNIFNAGISVSSLVTCSSENSFDAIDSLIFTTLYPLVAIALLGLIRGIHLSTRKGADAAIISTLNSKYFTIFLVFIYLVLPYISVTIFQTFSCQNVDPEGIESDDRLYMTIDYSVSCSSSKYKFGVFWASVCILVYPVGVPIFYLFVLNSARADICLRNNICSEADKLARDVRLRPLKLLFEFYKPDMWYWEVVETIHRLLITGVLVVVAQGSGAQIVIGLVISLLFMKVCAFYEPYADIKIQRLREICQWQIYCIFLLALLLRADFQSVSTVALDVLLFLAIIANFLLDIAGTVYNRYRPNADSTRRALFEAPLTASAINPMVMEKNGTAEYENGVRMSVIQSIDSTPPA